MGPTHRKRELGWGYQLHCLFQVLSILQAEDTKRTWRSVGSIDETAQVKRPIRSIRATFQDCRASSAVWTTEEQIERPPNPWRICLLDRRQHEPRPPRAPRNLGSNVWIHPPSMAHVTVNLKPRWARLTLLHLTASLVWLRIVSDSGNTDSRPRQARGGPLSLPRRRPSIVAGCLFFSYRSPHRSLTAFETAVPLFSPAKRHGCRFDGISVRETCLFYSSTSHSLGMLASPWDHPRIGQQRGIGPRYVSGHSAPVAILGARLATANAAVALARAACGGAFARTATEAHTNVDFVHFRCMIGCAWSSQRWWRRATAALQRCLPAAPARHPPERVRAQYTNTETAQQGAEARMRSRG